MPLPNFTSGKREIMSCASIKKQYCNCSVCRETQRKQTTSAMLSTGCKWCSTSETSKHPSPTTPSYAFSWKSAFFKWANCTWGNYPSPSQHPSEGRIIHFYPVLYHWYGSSLVHLASPGPQAGIGETDLKHVYSSRACISIGQNKSDGQPAVERTLSSAD